MVTTEQVKALRDRTGISIMQCKKALEDAGGDVEKAIVLLQKKGAEVADKKSDRSLGAGVVVSYIHGTGTIGTLVELWCETDFVAKNEEFKEFKRIKQKFLAHDKYGQLVFLADSDFTIQMTQSKYPSVKLFFTSEFD